MKEIGLLIYPGRTMTDKQVERLARVLAYVTEGRVAFDGKDPLDEPKWLDLANIHIQYILTGGRINE